MKCCYLVIIFLNFSAIALAQNKDTDSKNTKTSPETDGIIYSDSFLKKDTTIHPAGFSVQPPGYPGGMTAFDLFVKNQLKHYSVHFPARSYLKFVIEKNGRLTHIEIARSAGNKSDDREAIKIVRKSGRWIPGKVRGIPLRSEFVVRETLLNEK